jgi:c-di-GMP-binding flagellar brake protein YcgR
MGYLQELEAAEMSEALIGASDKRIPVTITIRRDESWLNLQSRFLAVVDGRLVLEPPVAPGSDTPLKLLPAEKVGVSFKHKHHKHLFNCTVVNMGSLSLGEGHVANVLRLGIPAGMQRVQRRTYFRAPIPEGHVVRVSFWLGGRALEPKGVSPERPVWSGRLQDLSAGGFLAKIPGDAAMALDSGDIVGARVTFGTAEEGFCVDAQVRYLSDSENNALLGGQFVALEQDSDGKNTLRIICAKVSEYQRLALSSRGRGKRESVAPAS